jgi:AcrR family transcriptional regulator
MADRAPQPIDVMRKMPTQGRAWRTVRTIFEATAQILAVEGEGRLTTNRVAERAGFSIGTLYQYFPSMDAILLAMIDLERRQVVARLEAVLAEGEGASTDPTEPLRRYVRELVSSLGTGDRAVRVLLRRAWLLDHTPQVTAIVRDAAERIHLALERRGHPDFPPPDRATLFVVTRSILGSIRAAVLEDSDLPGTPEFEDALVRMALALMRK